MLKEEMESGDTFMRNMATRMFGKFEKYWSDFSTIMAIATILDPRYKYQFAEWAYKKVYGDNYAIELRLLKDKLFALYAEYAKSSKGSSSSLNPPFTTAQANSTAEVRSNAFMQVLTYFPLSFAAAPAVLLALHFIFPKVNGLSFLWLFYYIYFVIFCLTDLF